ncbi:MAG: SGNH/GDSL hydrolase family protein, partial [Spartobacteria bacterium]
NPLRILCVGDSITIGCTDNPAWDVPFEFGYRQGLFTRLQQAGYQFQFVGSSPEPWDGRGGVPKNSPSPDLRASGQDRHEGHGGWNTAQVSEHIDQWIAKSQPDIVLLMIGINDAGRAQAAENLKGIVEKIVAARPQAHVVVAQITPRAGFIQDIADYNTAIRETLVPDFQRRGFKVTTVDQYRNMLKSDGTIDPGLFSNKINHPNATAYDRMAQTWFEAIQAVHPPPITSSAKGAPKADGKSHRLRMEVVRALPVPVIGKDTPGMESIPGGFEGGSSVKVMVNGKPEYHLFAHGYPRLDWSQSRLEHWVSPDGANFRRASVLQENFRDEKAGMNHIFCSPVPFYDEKSERWNLIFCEFVAESTWTGDSATIRRAQSKTPGKEGIGGPYDFENRSVFVPKQCAKIGAITPLATACSAPFQVQDGRWAVFVSTEFRTKDEKTGARQQKWPVMLNF